MVWLFICAGVALMRVDLTITMDESVKQRVDEIWDELGIIPHGADR